MATFILLPSFVPMALALAGLGFLVFSQVNKTWLPPLIAFILLASAAVVSMGSEFSICEGISCTDFKEINTAMAYIFGAICILPIVVLTLRILENLGQKTQDY